MEDIFLFFLFVAMFWAGRLTGIISGRNKARMEFIQLIEKAQYNLKYRLGDERRIGWFKCLSYLLERM